MAEYYVRSQQAGESTPGSGTYRGLWQASQTWAVGDRCFTTSTSATYSYRCYECTTGGAGGGTEPTWNGGTLGLATTDGSATWTTRAITTWANATIELFRVSNVLDAAGDVIYVRSDHSESTAGAVAYDWAGSAAAPVRVICVSDSNEPPTTVATGAVVTVTGANNLTPSASGDFVYFYGIRFKAGDSTNAADIIFAGAGYFENCAFELAGNNSGSDFSFTGSAVLVGCTFKSVNVDSTILHGAGINVIYKSCSIESGGTPGSPLFSGLSTGSRIFAAGFDFSNLSSSGNLFASTNEGIQATFINCKMPSSWSGSVNSSTPGYMAVYQLMNTDSADTNYRLSKKTQLGTVTHDTGIYLTAGASDGTTPISWKMVSNADSEWLHHTLDSPEIVRWNEQVDIPVTVVVEILHDSVTALKDNEVWLEVQYLGTSGYPLGTIIKDSASNYLSTGTNQDSSSASWSTGALSNPNKQKLSVTFTPREKGTVRAIVKLAKASYTVYVDPKLKVTY